MRRGWDISWGQLEGAKPQCSLRRDGKKGLFWDSEGMESMQEATGDGGKARQWQKDLPEVPERPSGEGSFANLFIWCLPLLGISLFNELIDGTGWERRHWDGIPCLLTRSSHNRHGLIRIQAWTNLGGPSQPCQAKAQCQELGNLPSVSPSSPFQNDLEAFFLQGKFVLHFSFISCGNGVIGNIPAFEVITQELHSWNKTGRGGGTGQDFKVVLTAAASKLFQIYWCGFYGLGGFLGGK